MNIFLIGTEFLNAGGIQRVNCMLARAFADFSTRMPCTIHAFSYLDSEPALPSEMRRESIRWHPSNRDRAALAMTLLREARLHQPDLLLLTHVSLLPLAPVVRALSPKTKIALLGHGIEVWAQLRPLHRALLRDLNSIIAPSQFTAERMASLNGLSAGRVRVIPHSLPPDWRAEASRRRANNPLRLLAVSRLDAADMFKGIEAILAALNAIRGRVPAFELTIAGDGTDRARLENISRAAGLDSVVRFAGRVADNDLRNLYASSDIFVLPSSKEGFGLVYLEAMSFGLPVLAAHAGGVVDIIESGVSGLLVPPEDLAALSQALRTLITDAGERDRLARNALARVQSSFLFSHFSRRWAEWTAAVCPYAVYAAAQRALLGKASPGHLLPLAS